MSGEFRRTTGEMEQEDSDPITPQRRQFPSTGRIRIGYSNPPCSMR